MDIVQSTPRRLPAAVRTNLEGIWTLGPEYEDALRESVRMQLSAALDNQLINGVTAAPALNGLITQIGLPSAARGSVVDWNGAVDDFVDVIEGLWASELSEVFAVVNPAGYRFVSKLFLAGHWQPGDTRRRERGGVHPGAVRRAPGAYPHASGVHERHAGQSRCGIVRTARPGGRYPRHHADVGRARHR